MPQYKIGNKVYNVPANEAQNFLNTAKQKNYFVEEVADSGKQTSQVPGAPVGETAALDMDSSLGNSSSELPKDNVKNFLNSTQVDYETAERVAIGEYFKLPTTSVPSSTGYGMIQKNITDEKGLRREWGDKKYEQYIDYIEKGIKPPMSDDFKFNKRAQLIKNKSENYFKNLSEEEQSSLNKKLQDTAEQIKYFNEESLEFQKSAEDYLSMVKANEQEPGSVDLDALKQKQKEIFSGLQSLKYKKEALKEYSEGSLQLAVGIDAAKLNYSQWDKFVKSFEKTIAGTTAKYGSMFLETIVSDSNTMLNDKALALEADGKAYYDELTNDLETKFYKESDLTDIKDVGVARYVGEALSSNWLSIGMALLSGGSTALAKQAAKTGTIAVADALAISNATKNIATGVFFATSAGDKYAELEKARDESGKVLERLEKEYKEAIGNDNLLEAEKLKTQIDYYNNSSDMSTLQMGAAAVAHGAAEGIGERLGSLRSFELLADMSKAVGKGPWVKAMYAGLNIGKGVAIEEMEETATQLLQNSFDAYIAGNPNTKLLDGLTADFFVKTGITSLAIGSPAHASNIWSIPLASLNNINEKRELYKIKDELGSIGEQLRNVETPVSSSERKRLNARRNELLTEAGLRQVLNLQKLNKLTPSEVDALFEAQVKQRKLTRELKEIGASASLTNEYKKKRAQDLSAEFDANQETIDNLSGKFAKEVAEKSKEWAKIAEEEGQAPRSQAEAVLDQGRYEMSIQIAERLLPRGGKIFRYKFLDKKKADGTVISPARSQLRAQLINEGFSLKDTLEITKALNNGYAIFLGNNIFLNEANIEKALHIKQRDPLASFAAVSPIHELLHIKLRKEGLANKDLTEAMSAIASKMDSLLEQKVSDGLLTKENKELLNKRITLYKKGENLDLEEVVNAISDSMTLGLINTSDVDLNFEFKRLVNSLLRVATPSANLFSKINTTEDLYNYLKSYNKDAASFKGKLVGDEEKLGVKASKAYENKLEEESAKIIEKMDALENRLNEGEIDYDTFEQQTENLEKQLAELPSKLKAEALKEEKQQKKKTAAATGKKIDELQAKSDKIQKEYDDAMAGIDRTSYKRDNPLPTKLEASLTRQLQGKVKGLVSKKFDQVQEEAVQFEDVVANLNIELVALLRTYNPAQGQPLTKYVDQNLKLRLAGVWQNVNKEFNLGLETGDGSTRQIADTSAEYNGSSLPELEHNEKENFTKSIDFSVNVDGITLQEHFDKALEKAVKLNLSQYQEQLSKNKTIPAFIEAIRIDMQESLRGIVKQFISEYGYEQFLNDKKDVILSNYTTTYLSKHAPLFRKGVQKSLNGKMEVDNQGNKLFKPNWVSPVLLNNKYEFVDENGKKGDRSTFDRDNAGALGRTSGPEFIRRNPKINSVISTNEFIDYHFQDGAQRKKEKQNPKDALARQIGSEAGLEIFKNDLLNNGPLSQIIETYGPLKGILLESGELRDYAKKVDRGTIKQSAEVRNAISEMLGDNGNIEPIENIISKWYNGLIIYDEADKPTKAIINVINSLNPIRNIENFTEEQAINTIINTIERDFVVEDNEILYRGHKTPALVIKGKLTTYGKETAKKISSALNAAIKEMGEEQAIQFIEQFLQYEADSIKRSPYYKSIKANAVFFRKIVGPMIKGTILEKKYEIRGETNKSIYRAKDSKRMNVDSSTSLETTSNQYKITENISTITKYNEEFAGKNLKSFIDTLSYLAEYGGFELASEYISISTASANSSLRKGAPVYLVMDNATKEIIRQEQLQLKTDPKYKNIKKQIKALKDKKNLTPAEVDQLNNLSSISAKIDRNTEFEHAYPASKLAYALLTHLISPSILSEEKIAEAKKDYWVALVPREVAMQLSKAGAGTTLGGATNTFGRLMLSPTMKTLYDQGNFISYNQDVVQSPKKSIVADSDVKILDDMLSDKSNIQGEIGEALATRLGKKKGKWKFFIPPSADDLMGLMYYMVGKGAKGDADLKFIKEKIIDPFAEGVTALETYKQAKLTEFRKFKKLIRVDGGIKLAEQNSTGFTNEQAVRVYLWTKKGNEVPDITEAERKKIMKYVNDTPYLLEYAKHIQNLFAAEGGYPDVEKNWIAGTMTIDILDHINTKARAEFLAEYNSNIETLFGKFNQKGEVSGPIANKMRAAFGNNYMEALSDVLYRMKHGRARQFGKNRLANQFNNWIANSIGAIMFFNRRSALLQQLSLINFINFSDNNPIAFAKAIGNTKQYGKDFTYLFTSDFLKQRRGGLQIDVNEDEIARAAEQGGNSFKNILAVILKKGFTFTTFADSFAIASGGATFYRNRINTYLKQGMELEAAEKKAFIEFKELTEESQQSSRPDRISQQQASSLGRLILAFANTPMQYSRLTKKAALDLINGRGDYKTNISKLLYYGAVQNVLFTGLQQALFSLMFDDDEEEREMDKVVFAANSMVDGLLRGLGFGGAVASVAKNMILEAIEQAQGRGQYDEVIWEALKLSPPIGSKISKARSVARTFMWKQEREKVFNKGFSLDNPIFMAIGQATSALTNIPLDRVIRDVDALSTPLRQETELWQDIALMLGWGKYELNLIERPKKKKKKSKSRGTTKRGVTR